MTTHITKFPCGCTLTTGDQNGEPTFLLEACSETCDLVRASLEMADEQDKPVRIMERDEITVTCLGCGKTLDSSTPVGGKNILPDPGSVSVCWYCATVCFYDANADGDLYLRLPTGQEQRELDADPMVGKMVEMVKARLQ